MNVTIVPQGSLRCATPIVVGVSTVPHAVDLPQNPGPYQVAALKTVQLGDELGWAVGSVGVVPPGTPLPPLCALADGAATQSAATQASTATARIVRLLVKPSSFVAYGVS